MNEIFIEIKQASFSAANNLTSGYGFDTANNLIGLLFILAISSGMLLLLTYVSSSFERFKRFTRLIKLIKSFGKTLNYAAYGGLTVVVIVAPVIMLYYGGSAAADNSEALIPVAKYAAIFIGIYAGLVIVGYISKNKIWRKIFNYRKRLQSEKYAENIKELPGVFKNGD